MGRSKIIDCSPFEILVDDSRTDVRRPCRRACISESLADRAHDRRDRPLLLRLDLRRPRSANAIAASSVPPQVRKSFAVNSSPRCSRMYSFRRRALRLTSTPFWRYRKRCRPPPDRQQFLDCRCELLVHDRGPPSRRAGWEASLRSGPACRTSLLLSSAKIGVVEALPPAGLVEPGCLEPGARTRGDPNSRHAGGIRNESMRTSAASSSMRRPRESS
jgi:hypothetical protein